MKVLYAREYFGRVLFVIERDNKVIFCYRSSGLSRTGHGGDILPFVGLNTQHNYEVYGYIYKEMYYNKQWVPHYKNLEPYPLVKNLMLEIKELTKDINPEPTVIRHRKIVFEIFVKQVSNELKKFNKLPPFDLYYDLENLK